MRRRVWWYLRELSELSRERLSVVGEDRDLDLVGERAVARHAQVGRDARRAVEPRTLGEAEHLVQRERFRSARRRRIAIAVLLRRCRSGGRSSSGAALILLCCSALHADGAQRRSGVRHEIAEGAQKTHGEVEWSGGVGWGGGLSE